MGKITMTEQAAASTPATNRVVLYPKSGGKLYHKDDTATELEIVVVPSASGAMTITPLAAGTMLNFALETEWVSGTLVDADFGSATTLSDDAVGIDLDFNANVTMTTDKDVIVQQIKLPALTQVSANTTVITGINIPTAGALVQNTLEGTITWTGVNLQMPNTTQTTGTVNSYGIKIIGGTVTSGTQYGIDIGNATTGISLSGTTTTGIAIANTNATGISFAAGAAYIPIIVGAKSNTADAGLILVGATDDTGGVQIFCDDGGDALGSVTSPIWTRYLITTNQGTGGPTATGLFAQIKTNETRTLTTGSYSALKAYNQAGTVTLTSGTEYQIINAGATLAGAMTVPTGATFYGVDINLGGAGTSTPTGSGIIAGLCIRDKAEGAVWTNGIYMPSVHTTGINIAGANATSIAISGANTSTSMLISGTWGSSANYGAITLAGNAAGTALALGASATSFIGVRIDLTAAVTAGNDFMAIHSELETSGAMVDGFIIGTYQRVRVAHVAYENYAIWGRMDVNVAQTGDSGNQYLGVFGSVNFAAGAHALTATGGGYGVLGTASIATGGTLDQPLIAGYFDCNAIDNIAGVTLAVRARMQNYTDYGVEAFCQTSNATAGFHIRATAAAALPVGILFTGENVGGQGSITKAFKFAAATNCGIAANTNTLTLTPTSHHIVVDIAGTDYYVPVFDTSTWT